MKVVVLAAITPFVAACAITPHPPPNAAVADGGSPPAVTSFPTAPTSAAAASSSAPPASSTAAGSSPTVDRDLIKRGYKASLRDGEVVYCKRTLTPDRFPVNRCYTEEQIKEIDRRTQGLVNHMVMPGNCVGFGCR